MQTLHMYMPELPRTRHIIVNDTHIINTAAPESNIYHRVERVRPESIQTKSPAQRRGKSYLVGE